VLSLEQSKRFGVSGFDRLSGSILSDGLSQLRIPTTLRRPSRREDVRSEHLLLVFTSHTYLAGLRFLFVLINCLPFRRSPRKIRRAPTGYRPKNSQSSRSSGGFKGSFRILYSRP
jgi:hypothetical protein